MNVWKTKTALTRKCSVSRPRKVYPKGLRYRLKWRKEMIVKHQDGYYVKSEKGKNLGGPYSTREKAERRLKEVEFFKHNPEILPKGRKGNLLPMG
jgi:hypothetical protein